MKAWLMSILNELQLQFQLQYFKSYTQSSEATKVDFAQGYWLYYGSYQKSDYTHVFLTPRASVLLSRIFFVSLTVFEILAFLCFPQAKHSSINRHYANWTQLINALIESINLFTEIFNRLRCCYTNNYYN